MHNHFCAINLLFSLAPVNFFLTSTFVLSFLKLQKCGIYVCMCEIYTDLFLNLPIKCKLLVGFFPHSYSFHNVLLQNSMPTANTSFDFKSMKITLNYFCTKFFMDLTKHLRIILCLVGSKPC